MSLSGREQTSGVGSFDFAVVGGGVVGLSIAYGLARIGHRVLTLDEDDFATRASRGNFSLLWLPHKVAGVPGYARWARRSISLWRQFASDLQTLTGIDVGLEQRGGFGLCLSAREFQEHIEDRERLEGALGQDGYPIHIVDRSELSRMLPAAGPQVVGGSFYPLNGQVNVLRLIGALHRACELAGGTYSANSKVEMIKPRYGGFDIYSAGRVLSVPRIVLAAGLGNARLAPMVGLDAPIFPQRGQLMITEKLDRFIDFPTDTVRQTDEGGIMIGSSKEYVGLDTSTTSSALSNLASVAVRMFPALARARIVRAWAALRVMTADECPIYDQSESCHGAYLVACHYGVTLAAVHALVLAQRIGTDDLAGRFKAFGARRFSDVQEAA
jgi:glycine/D-amino acid oxidase-like deaminating enzyme